MSSMPPTRLTWRQWRDPEAVIVCGFGSGFIPFAPGTWGSAAAVGLWWWLLAPLSLLLQCTVLVAVFVLGTGLTRRVQGRWGVRDDGAIVIDEFVGQWLVLLALPREVLPVAGAFLLFRFFDILKPWPVRAVERRVPGARGVMADDVVAGVLAAAVIHVTLWGVAVSGMFQA